MLMLSSTTESVWAVASMFDHGMLPVVQVHCAGIATSPMLVRLAPLATPGVITAAMAMVARHR